MFDSTATTNGVRNGQCNVAAMLEMLDLIHIVAIGDEVMGDFACTVARAIGQLHDLRQLAQTVMLEIEAERTTGRGPTRMLQRRSDQNVHE